MEWKQQRAKLESAANQIDEYECKLKKNFQNSEENDIEMSKMGEKNNVLGTGLGYLIKDFKKRG